MKPLKKNFENFRNGEYKELLDLIEDVFIDRNIDFYLIGAIARNLWVDGARLKSRPKGTLDIDFAMCIEYLGEYSQIIEDLISRGFEKTKHSTTLKFKNKFVDIVPFGGVQKDNAVELPEVPSWSVWVTSYKETLPHSFNISNKFHIVPLCGIFIMKLMAYYDRPTERVKDLDDIEFINENYFRIFEDDILENYPELFSETDDEEIVGIKVLAKDMNEILESQTELKSKVIKTLRELAPLQTKEELDELKELSIDSKHFKRKLLIHELIKELES